MTDAPDTFGGLSAISFSNLKDQVVQLLREKIILGQLPPGSLLGETRLARTLNVSRGTVRESLLELEMENLIETDETGKHFVIQLNTKSVADVFQVRAALESLAAHLISQSPERQKKQSQMEAMLEKLRDAETLPTVELMEVDLEFHRTLLELSGNSTLLESWKRIEGPLRVAIVYAGKSLARNNMTAKEHEPFIRALDADQEEPERLVFNTLINTATGLIAAYESPSK